MQKILLISENFPPRTGGSSRWFWEVYRRLPRDQVVIATADDHRQGEFDAGHDLNLKRIALTFSDWGQFSVAGIQRYAQAVLALRKVARDERVDFIHCGRLLPEGWIAWLLRKWCGLPYACFVHGEELVVGEISREVGWLMRRVLATAEFIIANSQNSIGILNQKWNVPTDRIRLLHPGADMQRFVPAPYDSKVRAALGWFDRPVILTVGRLQKRKGHDQLIQSIRILKQSIPDVLYSIVGDGEERPELEALVKQLDLAKSIQLLGETTDDQLIRCYQQCDLFVLPNREVQGDFEGFGMVLVEAQACGKPVVAGASGGTRETMHVGKTGRLVCCKTHHELVKVVGELLHDQSLRQSMGCAARAWVTERFSWEALSRQACHTFDISRVETPAIASNHSCVASEAEFSIR